MPANYTANKLELKRPITGVVHEKRKLLLDMVLLVVAAFGGTRICKKWRNIVMEEKLHGQVNDGKENAKTL